METPLGGENECILGKGVPDAKRYSFDIREDGPFLEGYTSSNLLCEAWLLVRTFFVSVATAAKPFGRTRALLWEVFLGPSYGRTMLFVESAIGRMQLSHGHHWFHPDSGMFVLVASFDEKTGEVVLRPEDSIQLWASKEKFGSGEGQDNCPFQFVTERVAKGSKGLYEEGDLLCNAAWDVWKKMRPNPNGGKSSPPPPPPAAED